MLNIFLKNRAKEIIKQYLFWIDFLEQSFSTIDELKEKLKTIGSHVVYQGEFNEFYLTQEEAQALKKKVKPLSIQEVLESESYPLFLIERLTRVSNYSRDDLKNIPKKSEVVWLYSSGVLMHFVLYKGSYIYPKEYPVNSIYRYGYMVVYNQDGMNGVYDIDSDTLVVPFEYKSITLFANLAKLSKDTQNYEMINLDTKKIIEQNTKTVFPNLSDKLKQELNLSKIDMEDYVRFFSTPKTQQDLVKMGLWNAKVGVIKLPSGYDAIIKENEGYIGWEYPISANVYDMSVELPVIFKKHNGEYVTLGIAFEDIILEDRTILNAITLPTPNTTQELPNWLKLKNIEFESVDISNNRVDEIIALSSDEFNEFVSLLGDDNIDMLLIYLKTLDAIELAEFFLYLEDVVKLDESVDAPSAKEQFEHMLENNLAEDLSDEVKARATLELPLFINYAKNIHYQALDFKEFIREKYYPYREDDSAIRYEGTLSKIVYSDLMKYIPDSFNQVLLHFSDYYDENNEEHKKIGVHLAKRFGLLTNALYQIQKAQDEKCDGLAWFLYTFNDEIKELDGYETLIDDKLIFYMLNTFSAILLENDKSYITSMIDVVNELMKYYPYLSESFLYALQELMKSVALKEMSIDNANRFLEIFEELPKLYDKLSYSKIIELKEMINIILANDKPQENKIFDEEGVKSKLIILNYLVDMEDLYHNGLEGEKN